MQAELHRKVATRRNLQHRWMGQLVKAVVAVVLLALTLLVRVLAARRSDIAERLYATTLYPILSQAVNALFRWMPFSAAEFLAYGLVIILVGYLLFQLTMLVLQRQRPLRAVTVVVNFLLVSSSVYALFIGLWGLNYYREPLAQTLGYEAKPRSVSELRALSTILAQQANEQRIRLQESLHGYVTLVEGKQAALQKVPLAYRKLADQSNIFSAKYGAPKPVHFSRQMSYTNTEGIFIPFTIEANVNMDIPDAMFPSTACHEAAHQYGFAREDEANFIAYLAAQASEDSEFMYAGTLLALTHTMNALYGYDAESYREVSATYSPGVKRDIRFQSLYWQRFEGPVAETSNKVNDAYLKSNDQSDGINSYGRMVDLLLAHFADVNAGE